MEHFQSNFQSNQSPSKKKVLRLFQSSSTREQESKIEEDKQSLQNQQYSYNFYKVSIDYDDELEQKIHQFLDQENVEMTDPLEKMHKYYYNRKKKSFVAIKKAKKSICKDDDDEDDLYDNEMEQSGKNDRDLPEPNLDLKSSPLKKRRSND